MRREMDEREFLPKRRNPLNSKERQDGIASRLCRLAGMALLPCDVIVWRHPFWLLYDSISRLTFSPADREFRSAA